MLKVSEIVAAISKRAEGRYEAASPEKLEADPTLAGFELATVQLRRISQPGAGWRTILIAAFPFDSGSIQAAFRWAADVRDMLAEPQTADLYMFLAIEGIASEDAARLETDDRFCRKIVAREEEDVESFLDRSFLATLSPSDSSDSISDPLSTSLAALVAAYAWIEPHRDTWRGLLLSGQSGSEIAEALATVAFDDGDVK